MVNVGAAFYQCNSTNNGYIGTTSPSIQGLNLDKGCCPTVIELTYFAAEPGNDTVQLVWKTETETENVGFNVLRGATRDGEYSKINAALIPAQGDSTQGATYDFSDNAVKNGKAYYYKLEDIDQNGSSTYHGPVKSTPRLIYWLWK